MRASSCIGGPSLVLCIAFADWRAPYSVSRIHDTRGGIEGQDGSNSVTFLRLTAGLLAKVPFGSRRWLRRVRERKMATPGLHRLWPPNPEKERERRCHWVPGYAARDGDFFFPRPKWAGLRASSSCTYPVLVNIRVDVRCSLVPKIL